MKYLTLVLSLINGLWMLVDGAYVMLTGKYIGPENPGPWASLLRATGVDLFKLGPGFVLFGLSWVVFASALWAGWPWARNFGIVISLLTLWYLPFGTLISIVVLVILIFFSERLRLI